MNWKEQLDKAIAKVRDAADSEKAREISAKAKATATNLMNKAREGAVSTADAFVAANRDPSTMEVSYMNAQLAVLSPADELSITRPEAATLVLADGLGNGLVINAAADPAFVSEMIGTVTQVSGNTYDLGAEDGINLVVTKF